MTPLTLLAWCGLCAWGLLGAFCPTALGQVVMHPPQPNPNDYTIKHHGSFDDLYEAPNTEEPVLRLLYLKIDTKTEQDKVTVTVEVHFASHRGLMDVDGSQSNAGATFVASQIAFSSPLGHQSRMIEFMPSVNLIRGTRHHGVYQSMFELSAYTEPGPWQVSYVIAADNFDEKVTYYRTDLLQLGLPTTFVANPNLPHDTQPPSLEHIRFLDPTTRTTNDPYSKDSTPEFYAQTLVTKQLHVAVRFSDDHAGIMDLLDPSASVFAASYIQLESVDAPIRTGQRVVVPVRAPALIEGDHRKGTLRVDVDMPKYAWPGTWQVTQVRLVDAAGNSRMWQFTLGEEWARDLGELTCKVQNMNVTYYGGQFSLYRFHDYWNEHPDPAMVGDIETIREHDEREGRLRQRQHY